MKRLGITPDCLGYGQDQPTRYQKPFWPEYSGHQRCVYRRSLATLSVLTSPSCEMHLSATRIKLSEKTNKTPSGFKALLHRTSLNLDPSVKLGPGPVPLVPQQGAGSSYLPAAHTSAQRIHPTHPHLCTQHSARQTGFLKKRASYENTASQLVSEAASSKRQLFPDLPLYST